MLAEEIKQAYRRAEVSAKLATAEFIYAGCMLIDAKADGIAALVEAEAAIIDNHDSVEPCAETGGRARNSRA